MRAGRSHRSVALCAGLLLLAAPVLSGVRAADDRPGNIEGVITDPARVPLAGATVEVGSETADVARVVLTDEDGHYRVSGLPAGTDYVLTVSFAGGGYARVIQDRLVIRAGLTTVESVQLFAERTEEVIVSAKRPGDRVVNLKEVGQVTEFTSEFIEGLPLLGRNYQDVLTLAAGVVDPDDDGNPNVLGARAENFNTVIDGVSNQDPLGGTFLSNLNTDAIEQVEVIQTGADASFRRASGGFANIITKSGSNEFEGTFTLSFRSSLFDGNGATGNDASSFRSVRPALTVSGALRKDKLWYFLTDEEFNDDFPLNTLNGTNTLVQSTTGRRVLGKLTWAVTAANKLTAQVRADPLDFTNLGVNSRVLPEAGFTQRQGGPFYNVQLDSIFSPTVLLKSLVAFQDSGIDIIPTTPQDPRDNRPFTSLGLNFDQDTGAVTGGWFLNFKDKRQRLTFTEDLTVFVDDFFGRHDLAMGLSFEREHFERDLFQGTVRTFARVVNLFGSGNDLDAGGEQFLVQEQFAIPANPAAVAAGRAGFNHLEGDSDNFGVYITDTWLPRDNVSITAGLRWDREEVVADGFAPFDPRTEFSSFQQFLIQCESATPGAGQVEATERLLAGLFPAEFAAFKRNGGSFGASGRPCNQATPFFFTFPKKKFTDDCLGGRGGGTLCTTTLSGALPTLVVKGNRPGSTVNVNNNNLSPRFNVSWDPWSNGKTRVFATYGRFFDKTNLATAVAEQGPDVRSRVFTFTTGCTSDVVGACGIPRDAGGGGSDPTITQVNRNLRTQFNEEWTVGFEREIAPETKIRITWISRHFRDQLQDTDLNHFARDVGPEFFAPVRRKVAGRTRVVGFIPLGGNATCELDPAVNGLVPTKNVAFVKAAAGRLTTVGEPAAVPNGHFDDCFGTFASSADGGSRAVADGVGDLFRRDVFFNNVLFLSNSNISQFSGFTVEFVRRMKRNWQLQASWTHARSVGAADSFQDESGNDPSLVTDEFGFTGFDIRNVVKVNLTTILPWGDFQLGTVMNYFSGTPFSLRELESSSDNRGQPTFRTVFPTGRRNDQRNDPHLQIDLLGEKAFLIKKYTATATVVIENILADDFLDIADFVDGRLQATRDFGRRYEARFKINF
ncbi:MAG: carboxypeptidase regulatory-like domain-containing protein [Acidobacteriota bacterium]